MGFSSFFPLLELPDEIISEILSHLPRQDRLWCCMVCKRFLKLLFDLNNGIFELYVNQTNFENSLKQMLNCEEISGLITHFVVTYPYESIADVLQKVSNFEVKGI